MTDADRITALEAEVRGLKLLLGKQQRTVVAPPRRDEPVVRITHPVSKVSMPTAAECVLLWMLYGKNIRR